MTSKRGRWPQFERAEATNTRLMGVVALVAHWRMPEGIPATLLLHLDYEQYGVDGIEFLEAPDSETLKIAIQKMAGGLGGTFVPVTFKDCVSLIRGALKIDSDMAEIDPFDVREIWGNGGAAHDFETPEFTRALMRKLSPPIESDIQAINYALMRAVGSDAQAAECLWDPGVTPPTFDIFDRSYTLIKSTCHLIGDADATQSREHLDAVGAVDAVAADARAYRVEAIVDFDSRYRLMVFQFGVRTQNHALLWMTLMETLDISSIEAAFNLNQPEYFIAYYSEDSFFERRFEKAHPQMMKNVYDVGSLYVDFFEDNSHVARTPYTLNGDIRALYHFGLDGELLVCASEPSILKEIARGLEAEPGFGERLHFVCEIKTNAPVLYSFLMSDATNIFDFLSR